MALRPLFSFQPSNPIFSPRLFRFSFLLLSIYCPISFPIFPILTSLSPLFSMIAPPPHRVLHHPLVFASLFRFSRWSSLVFAPVFIFLLVSFTPLPHTCFFLFTSPHWLNKAIHYFGLIHFPLHVPAPCNIFSLFSLPSTFLSLDLFLKFSHRTHSPKPGWSLKQKANLNKEKQSAPSVCDMDSFICVLAFESGGCQTVCLRPTHNSQMHA